MHDLACVVHLHSTYSDGTGTVPQIARAGARAGADVVLLTDHDTLEAKQRGEEGWYGSVLLLVGEEVSPEGGDHYIALGLDDHVDHEQRSPGEVCEAVRRQGGFGFAAHPWSGGSVRFKRAGSGMPFRDLDCEALHGVELWSFATDTGESLRSIPELIRFLAAPGSLLRHPPERNVRGWDELCRERRTVAIGGLDAHQFGKRVGPFVPLRLMGYHRSFRFIRTHVLAREPLSRQVERDRELVFEPLRVGRCYIAVDAVAPAGGFSFHAERPEARLEMGEQGAAGDWTLRAETPLPATIRLVRDGEPLDSAEGSELVHPTDEPGVYRVEALRDGRTWILSNPIYLR